MLHRIILIFIVLNTYIKSEDRAVLIGINDYSESGRFSNLRYAEEDASVLENILGNSFRIYRPEKGREVTRKNTLELLQNSVSDLKPEDQVFFFFSGHGADQSLALQNGEISVAEIISILRKSKKFFMVIDACRTSEDQADSVSESFMPLTDPSSISGGNRIILYSAGKGQTSRESKKLRHSVFTYHFIQELKEELDNPEILRLDAEQVILGTKEKISRHYTECTEQDCIPIHPEVNSSVTGKYIFMEKRRSYSVMDYAVPGRYQWKNGKKYKTYIMYPIIILPALFRMNSDFAHYSEAENSFRRDKKLLFMNSPGRLDSLDLYLYQSSSDSRKKMNENRADILSVGALSVFLLYSMNFLDLKVLSERENLSMQFCS
ncbi:MAG TPA: caspase family protein, partial [Leptospiraceae bacterium]|nr:caspase family protein [Leptospiraceae bacterium]